MPDRDVVIVGGGLAGLACARALADAGRSCVVLEAGDALGGRVATDEVDGFLLDRGFQVLLSTYPEVHRLLDFERLEAGRFGPGALVRHAGRFHRVVDPWRAPVKGALTLRAPFLSLGDALRMARLRRRALVRSPREVEGTLADLLRRDGFSAGIVEAFFRPFFGGVTLDRELRVPASYFLFLFRMFATGDATLPARGMRALPAELARSLPADTVRLGARVEAVEEGGVRLASGERVDARDVVVATDGAAAGRLVPGLAPVEWSATTTLHYAAETPPVDEPLLVLAGEGDGPVNHVAVLTAAQRSYAPAGAELVSVSVLGVPGQPDGALDRDVRAQLGGWFGAAVGGWRLLRVDRIPHALPRMRATAAPPENGVRVCGDHLESPSIQGALVSGRRTAERLLGA